MKLLFEGFPYNKELLQRFGFNTDKMKSTKDKKSAFMPYVGYQYSSANEEPIFILPKVFISKEESKQPVAFFKYHPEDIIDFEDKENPLVQDGKDSIISELSLYIYSAIKRYSIDNENNESAQKDIIRNIKSVIGKDSKTVLDAVISLINFYKKNNEPLTFITISSHSGNNHIDWKKTIAKELPIFQKKVPIYMNFWNKNQEIDYNEKLIVLFYSVLNYLKIKYHFPVKTNLNYEIYKPDQIRSMIKTGRAEKWLRSAKRQYYSDLMVKLWNLLYAFFSNTRRVSTDSLSNEYLLSTSFSSVFEAMIDNLVGENLFESLKKNKDGKMIDHIFKYRSLVDDSSIFYIGDSKYYSYDTDITGISNEKQFTYAKNIIQLNINNQLNSDNNSYDGVRYRDSSRDSDTEGYNPTPNFFILGYIDQEESDHNWLNYSLMNLKEDPTRVKITLSRQFNNRLFDRDTLHLSAFKINFLYVLREYVNGMQDSNIAEELRKEIRNKLVQKLSDMYYFYKVTPKPEDLKNYVDTHFRKYIGQMYSPQNKKYLIFAFEKNSEKKDQIEKNFKDEKVPFEEYQLK